MPRVLLLSLLTAACATPRAVEALPCTDADAPRCLQFLELAKRASDPGSEDRDVVNHALERYCLRGSTQSCQLLATRRRDNSLAQLCRDGVTEACELPDERRSQATLLGDCEQARPGACRTWLRTSPERQSATMLALESACAEGIASTCFELAQRLPPGEAERSSALTWRACLAGVREACTSSDTSAARCRKGERAACEPFAFEAGDSAVLHAKKRSVLEDSCRQGVPLSCQRLRGELGDEAALALACGHEEACESLAVSAPMQLLGATCGGAPGLARETACATLLRHTHIEELEDVVRPVEAWARERCAASMGAKRDCQPLEQWLLSRDQHLAAMRLRCERGACAEKEGLALVDACLGNSLQDCPRAAVWLQQQQLLTKELSDDEVPLVQRVIERACDAKEAMFCVRAASSRAATALQSLAFLERGCALGSKEGCSEAKTMAADKRACDSGTQCRAWFGRMKVDERPVGLAVLERTCRKNVKEDCDALWLWLSRGAALRKCVEKEAPCPVEKLARPRLVKLLTACDAGTGVSCRELIDSLFDGSIDRLALARLEQPEPELLKWANAGCEAGGMTSCELVARLSEGELEVRALEKACEVKSGEACFALAKGSWMADSSPKDRLSPALVQARARAVRACELGIEQGCALAADFIESGIGGPADALEAERLRQR